MLKKQNTYSVGVCKITQSYLKWIILFSIVRFVMLFFYNFALGIQ